MLSQLSFQNQVEDLRRCHLEVNGSYARNGRFALSAADHADINVEFQNMKLVDHKRYIIKGRKKETTYFNAKKNARSLKVPSTSNAAHSAYALPNFFAFNLEKWFYESTS